MIHQFQHLTENADLYTRDDAEAYRDKVTGFLAILVQVVAELDGLENHDIEAILDKYEVTI